MLKTTPLELYQEAQKALALQKKVNASRKEMIEAYAGEHYRSDWKPKQKIIDNRFDEYVRLILPQIVFNNPKVSVKTNRSGVEQAVPMALEAAINWWAPQVRLANVLRDVAYDAAFTFGVVLTTYGPPPGREPWLSENDTSSLSALPRVQRIDPCRWFCDHSVDKYDPATGQGRLAGHVFRADKDMLMKDSRFNKDAVKQCATGEGQKQYGGEESDREEVYGYEIWIPEIKTKTQSGEYHPDAHGTIFTIGLSQSLPDTENATWLRDPRPYIGPSCGPYTLFGMGVMPGSPYPYSPFAASWDQIQMLNTHVEAAERSAKRHKRGVGVDAANTQAEEVIRKFKDGDVFPIRDMEKSVKEISLGGVTQEQHDHIQRRGEQADRSLALSETARGNVNVDTSATAIADAASQRSARLASMKRLMTEGAIQVLTSAAWHLYTHKDAAFPLPPDVAESFVPRPANLPDPSEAENVAAITGVSLLEARKLLEYKPEVIYGGGPSDQTLTEIQDWESGGKVYVVSPYVKGTRFEDFELEIEPYSMERVDEALLQRRSMQVFTTVTQILPLIQNFPQVKWEDLIDMIGDPMNMPNLSDRVIGRAWLNQLRAASEGQGMAMAGGMIPGQPQPQQPGGINPPRNNTDGADGMNGQIGESVYGGGNLAKATAN